MFRYRSFLFAVILLMLFQGKMHAQGFGPSMNGGQRISNNQTPDSLKRRMKTPLPFILNTIIIIRF